MPLVADSYIDKPSYLTYKRHEEIEPTVRVSGRARENDSFVCHLQTAQTAAAGRFEILTEEMYQSKYASHTLEWSLVMLLSLAVVGAPYVYYQNIENALAKKK